jgi:hypothetical protein
MTDLTNSANSTNSAINKYETKLQEYVGALWNPFIFFEINKCCGYSQFVPTYRDGTLKDLHRAFLFHFGFAIPTLVMKRGDDLLIVQDEDILLKDFMRLNSEFFEPAYSLPAKVVYRIYFSCKCCGCAVAENTVKG